MCEYYPDKCPDCGEPMSQEGYPEEDCSNEKCDFSFFHCGDCYETHRPSGSNDFSSCGTGLEVQSYS